MTIKTLYPNVRPTLDLAFAATKALDPRITFTRASAGTYVGSNGTLRTAGINEARFDHSPLTLESLGLLVEEARTNLLSASEEMVTAPWGLAAATGVANNGIAPDETTTADKIISTGGGCFRAGAGVVNATAYTYSVFLKHVTGTGVVTQVGFERFGSTPLLASISVNLLTGTITNNGAPVTSSSITRYSNNWYRVSITATSTDVTTTVVNYTGTSGNEFLIWGAQLEAGAFATSYIPTTSATVTRAADVASISSSAFSSWYRQGEGTVFVNATTNATHGGSNSFPRKLSISDGINSNSIEDYYRVLASYTDAGYRIDAAGVNQAQFDTNNQRNGQSSVIGYAANNSAFAVGGTVVATDLSGTVPTTTQLRLGQRGDGSAALNGTIRRLTYWPWRLSNATLQALTS